MGFWVSQRGQLGANTPSLFSERFPLKSMMRSGGATPPPPPNKSGVSATCSVPYQNKAERVRYPPLQYYLEFLERVLRDMGGYLALGR